MGGLPEGDLGRLPRERRSLEVRWGGEHSVRSQCAEDVATCTARRAGVDSSSRQGAQGQGTLPSVPVPVIRGTRKELGDATGTLARAEWVEHSVDLLLEAQVRPLQG